MYLDFSPLLAIILDCPSCYFGKMANNSGIDYKSKDKYLRKRNDSLRHKGQKSGFGDGLGKIMRESVCF